MGNCCPIFHIRRRPSDINPKNVTLLLVGLDNAGKTTIAKRLSEEPLDGILPTVGFSKVALQEKGCSVTIYDLGGGPQIRDIWPRYYADVHGVIFVVDASDIARMNECRKALEGVLLDSYISGKPILLLANKQDLEGALDEIDIVDRLNVERLVNQQKCPTLVELCSARHFSRKMDVGIDNGYKWLLRCISKEYPSLNMRVLKDSATQEELERIQRAQRAERIRKRQQERELDDIQQRTASNNAEYVQLAKDDKPYTNGIIKMVDKAGIPGQIEDAPNTQISLKKEGPAIRVRQSVSCSSEFLKYEQDNSDIELVQSAEERIAGRSFLVRPKSSGARLITARDQNRRKTPRRKSYRRNNKTAPNPVVDLTLQSLGPVPKIFDPAYHTEVKPFSELSGNEENFPPKDGSATKSDASDITRVGSAKEREISFLEGLTASKSTPNSRKASRTSRKRCTSSDHVSCLTKLGELPPLKLPGRHFVEKEVILDVTKLVE